MNIDAKLRSTLIALVVGCISIGVILGCGRRSIREPYSISDRLPAGVKIIREFKDRSGMDAFFLWKATYRSAGDIFDLRKEFLLQPHQETDGSVLSFAEIFDERYDIAWFPLSRNDEVYVFCSVNSDGTFKEGVQGRYTTVLWVDGVNKELVIQIACM